MGALLRYLASGWAHELFGSRFPWGTLCVNLVGCLMIGLLWAMFESVTVSQNTRALLLVGLLGAFTTFSTFSLESLNMLHDRQFLLAGGNLLGSCLAGLLMVYLGMLAGRGIGAIMK